MSICKLPPGTVKLITSAQVITSVSSVVKELIENSLDAEATNIEVMLENHGLDRIEVKDNGKGIHHEDVFNMCRKGYTSKIRSFEDLNKLDTYGFRGEALNSLCAISKVSVTTITAADNVAMSYEIDNNGNVISSKLSHIIRGTIVVVENLFKNLPVRKQFLSNGRRKADEIKKVEMTIKSLAIIQPKLRLVLTHNKFCIWKKNCVPDVRQSLIQVVAPTVVKQLVDLHHECEEATFFLMVPRKGCNVSSTCYGNPGDSLYLFINRRPVKDRNIEKIVQDEIFNFFGHEIPSGRYPTSLVSIVLPPDCLDVNLEPNKNRVILKYMDKIGNILKNQLFEYYVGKLAPSKDFFEEIDAEVDRLAQKRKNCDELIEIPTKIPKTSSKSKCDSTELTDGVNDISIPKSEVFIISDSTTDNSSSSKCTSTDNISLKIEERIHDVSFETDQDTSQLLDYFVSNESRVANSSPEMGCEGLEKGTRNINVKESDPGSTNSLNIDNITLSQWSRGEIQLNGDSVTSSTTVVGIKAEPFNLETSSTAIAEDTCLDMKRKKMEEETKQLCERSVSSQMGCKDMAGFTRYATEVANEISKGPSGISFGKVASELANKWHQLQDNEKEMYNQKAKSKQKEKEDRANASMRERLQNFLTKSNEKKVLKKNNFWKTVEIDLSIVSLRKAVEMRVSQKKEIDTQYIGQLSEDIKCAVAKSELYLFSEQRLLESLLFFKNLRSMLIPFKVLEFGINVRRENIGESLWSILVSMETAHDIRTGTLIISDNRLTSNGIRIEIVKDNAGSCCYQITDVPMHVPFFELDDLIEILNLIESNTAEAELESCRPLKIVSYIRAETIRFIGRNSLDKVENLVDKFKFWLNTIHLKIERCPHQNPVYKVLNLDHLIK